MFLGVLIGPQREDVEALGAGDLDDPGNGFFHRRPAEMMAKQRIGCLPGESARPAFAAAVRPAFVSALFAAQVSDDGLLGCAAGEDMLEQSRLAEPTATQGSVPPKSQVRSVSAARRGLGRQFLQQIAAVFRRQAIAHGDNGRIDGTPLGEQLVHADRRPQADGLIAELLGQIKKVDDAGYVDTIADGGADDQLIFHVIAFRSKPVGTKFQPETKRPDEIETTLDAILDTGRNDRFRHER